MPAETTGIDPIPSYPMPDRSELPANVVDWVPDPDRAVLLIHDMQRYFLRPFAAGGSPLRPLVANVAALRSLSREARMPIAYTTQPGSMTEAERGLLKDFWGPGMRVDPEDQRVVSALAPRPGDWVFTKWRYSAFFRSDLLARIRAAGRDQLLVAGVYAHVGVLMSAVEAFSHDIQPFMVADAVADFGPERHRFALQYAAARCASVVTTADVVDDMNAARGRRPLALG
jgi:isochorismate hydrolase